ncbi:MAG TPA: anion transporter [Pirellulales bacterium]|nr:anion transporter [Pirellulales bacterium]
MTDPDPTMLLTTLIFAATYFGLAIGKVPGLRVDRAGIALIGAAAVLASGLLDLPDAARAVDYQTIVLLFSMMVVVAYLNLSGFFAVVTEAIADYFGAPMPMLATTIGLSGFLSAFLVNDVVCVALTPLVVGLCRRLRRPPMPYLIGLAAAANVGSVATITGNPQNIMIGSFSGISYLRFCAKLGPIALVGLVVTFIVVAWVYRKQLVVAPWSSPRRRPLVQVHRPLLVKSVAITLATVVLFFAGQPISLVALTAAGVMMLSRVRPEKIYRAVDWPLLVMFTGLFVVVHAFEVNVVHAWNLDRWQSLRQSPVVMVSGLSVGLSNLVSNVPAVLLFKPLIEVTSQQERAWLALSMSSTLAGNLTLLGSVANLIVVESARRSGAEISFLEYLKVGLPLTLLTTGLGVAWLQWVSY